MCHVMDTMVNRLGRKLASIIHCQNKQHCGPFLFLTHISYVHMWIRGSRTWEGRISCQFQWEDCGLWARTWLFTDNYISAVLTMFLAATLARSITQKLGSFLPGNGLTWDSTGSEWINSFARIFEEQFGIVKIDQTWNIFSALSHNNI